MDKAHTYPTNVFWDERDECFVAIAPDLPGCSAFGDTRAKALKELEQAIKAWIETALAAGEVVPEPSSIPKPNSYSGKFLLRIPSSLHERIAKEAAQEGVSLNQWIITLISAETFSREQVTIKPEDRQKSSEDEVLRILEAFTNQRHVINYKSRKTGLDFAAFGPRACVLNDWSRDALRVDRWRVLHWDNPVDNPVDNTIKDIQSPGILFSGKEITHG